MKKLEKNNREKFENLEIDEESELSYYFKIFNKFSPLSKEEESLLFKKVKKGDKEAEKKLILSNLRLVIWVARKYQSKKNEIPLIDLISEGNLGLIKAIKKYNPEKYKNKFSSYAVCCISRSLWLYVSNIHNGIHLPANILKKKKFLENIEENSLKSTGSLDSLLSNSEFDRELVKKLKNLPNCSLYKEKDNLFYDTSNYDTSNLNNSETDENDPLYTTLSNILREKLYKIVNKTLNEREKSIIFMRYGWIDDKNYTLQEIAEKLKISRERVRQIQQESLEKLRNSDELKKASTYFL
jgi:RNA polymerase primary sigma factor